MGIGFFGQKNKLLRIGDTIKINKIIIGLITLGIATTITHDVHAVGKTSLYSSNIVDPYIAALDHAPLHPKPKVTLDKKLIQYVLDKKDEKKEVKKVETKSEETHSTRATTTKLYSLPQFMSAGVINWQGYKFTYYSQQVLPGGGLVIPGRHVNKDGYVSDKDGYIVLAGSAPKGTVYDTPFGYKGKIYDRGTVGNHLDVYIR